MSDVTKLPSVWEAELGIKVYDPDGWDRLNFAESWGTAITRDEFIERAWQSTCTGDFSAIRERADL